MAKVGCLFLLVLVTVILQSSATIDYSKYFFRSVPYSGAYPAIDREGTVSGQWGDYVYFAGGVNTRFPTIQTFTAFTDIYTYDMEGNSFMKAHVSLPEPTFYGSGGVYDDKLYIYSGRTNTQNSSIANTYFSDIYVIDFTDSIEQPAVSTIKLAPARTGRQFTSSYVSSSGMLYVFGGTYGPAGDIPVIADPFFVVDLSTGDATTLPCSDSSCPSSMVVSPVMFMSVNEDILYVYGGFDADYHVTGANMLYSFDIEASEWRTPVTVSGLGAQVWGGTGISMDGTKLMVFGGNAGTDNGGSSDIASVWDITYDPPEFTQLSALPFRIQSSVVGIRKDGNAFMYSGSRYSSSQGDVADEYQKGVLSLVPYSAGVPEAFCPDDVSVLLTDPYGVITDHTGGGNVEAQVKCSWTIVLPNEYTQIRVQFEKFDLAFGSAWLTLYGAPESKYYTDLTGDDFPDVVNRPFIVPGHWLTVEFVTDVFRLGTGFIMRYEGVKCQNQCSGNGICVGDICQCNPGYRGLDCSESFCEYDCASANGAGVCVNGSCQCAVGHYGGACVDRYCSGRQVIVSDSNGTFSDHLYGGSYLDLTDCSWEIRSQTPGASISIEFTRFDTEFGYDMVTVYDGADTETANIIGSFSGPPSLFSYIPKIISSTGVVLITFTSDVSVTRSGFDVRYFIMPCAEECEHGSCIGGHCWCDYGWTGSRCNETQCVNSCSGRGTCGNGTCTCPAGYGGADCGFCNDLNTCLETCAVQALVPTASFRTFTSGPYTRSQECKWFLNPDIVPPYYPNTMIIQFPTVDIQPGKVSITTGVRGADAALSVINKPASRHAPIVIDIPVYVSLVSQADATSGAGFYAIYNEVNCTEACSEGWGLCLPGGKCDCYMSRSGDYCEIESCPVTAKGVCDGHGTCTGNSCFCDPQYSGDDCSIPTCWGDYGFSVGEGELSDHAEISQYQQQSYCNFYLSATGGGSTLYLKVKKLSLSPTVDYLEVYDNGLDLIGRWTGFLPPKTPILSTSGYVSVYFQTGAPPTSDTIERNGWTIQYFTVDPSTCNSECSQNGYCTPSGCVCFNGFSGSSCAQSNPDVTALTAGEISVKSVRRWEWAFFSYEVETTAYQVAAEVTYLSGAANPSDAVHLYVQGDKLPSPRSRLVFDMSDNPTKHVVVHDVEKGKKLIFGVEGQESGPISFSIVVRASCPVSCGHGVCEGTTCKCNSDWCGDYCNRRCESNNMTLSGVGLWITILVVLGLLAGGAVGIVLLAIWLHKRRTARLTNNIASNTEGGITSQEVEMAGIEDHPTDGTYARFT